MTGHTPCNVGTALRPSAHKHHIISACNVGFQKMQATQTLGDGSKITVHYQLNTITGEAFDYKFVNAPRSLLKPKPPKGN